LNKYFALALGKTSFTLQVFLFGDRQCIILKGVFPFLYLIASAGHVRRTCSLNDIYIFPESPKEDEKELK